VIKLILVVAVAIASQYGNGVAERVVNVRQHRNVTYKLPLKLPEVDGYIAVRDCHHIGEVWQLRPKGEDFVENFLVIDCSGSAETTAWMNRNNIIAEVDFQTAQRWDTVGRGIKIERVRVVNTLGRYNGYSYFEMQVQAQVTGSDVREGQATTQRVQRY